MEESEKITAEKNIKQQKKQAEKSVLNCQLTSMDYVQLILLLIIIIIFIIHFKTSVMVLL